MNLEITGKLAVKYDTVQVKESFKKREFVMDVSEEVNGNLYSNFAKLQLVQNKCEILDRFNEGDLIKVNFGIRGNKWEKDGKVNYITNLDAWRIEYATPQNIAEQTQAMPSGNMNGGNTPSSTTGSFSNSSSESSDDLPF